MNPHTDILGSVFIPNDEYSELIAPVQNFADRTRLVANYEQMKMALTLACDALEWNASKLGLGGPEAKGQDALARHSQEALHQIRTLPLK